MKSNYICTNIDCDYTTNSVDNLKIKDLDQIVMKDGGYIEGKASCCPKCKKDSLVYISE